jgi:hypothetical protein
MTLEKARELLAVQADMGGGYNRNGARLILAEVQADHGQTAVDALIRELRPCSASSRARFSGNLFKYFTRHCEEQSDEAISEIQSVNPEIAALRSQ